MAGAGYRLFTAGQVLTAAQVNTYLQEQANMVFASASARDTALSSIKSEGNEAFLLDVNSKTYYTGSTWSTLGPVHGGLASWTPTVTQGATPVFASSATYSRIGRRILGDARIQVSSGTGTAANNVVVGLPVATSALYVAASVLGNGFLLDSSANLVYHGSLIWVSSSTASIIQAGSVASGTYLGSSNFTAALASGDQISWVFSYEAAADA